MLWKLWGEKIIVIFGFNAENIMKIRQGMTSGECVENKWFNMKYIGKYISVEILLTQECI